MFYNCNSLKSIDLTNFNPQNIINVNYTFSGCNSLIYLNISQFDAESLKHISSMFSNCNSLIILDLANLNANSISSFLSVFDNCESLRYIDLYNYKGGDIFESILTNLNFKYCMKTNEIKNNQDFSLYNYMNICSDTSYNSPIIYNEIEKNYYINCIELPDNLFCNYEHSDIISIVPDGYYLNIKACNIKGDEQDNKCLECIFNYRFIKEYGYENNCYEECPYYYFDDLNKFHCTKDT